MSRTTCVTALLMLACINTSHAAEAEDELAACRAIEADAERVACYDAIASGQAAEEGQVAEEGEAEEEGQVVEEALAVVPAAAAVEVASSPEVTPPAEETFGDPANNLRPEDEALADSDDPDQITATVTSVREYKRDRFMVTLDNGQEWRQTSASTLRLSVDDKIVVRKAALGSYKMAKEGSSRSMKVRLSD